MPFPAGGQSAGLVLGVVPRNPQDDWTRPVPRTPRADRRDDRTRAFPQRGGEHDAWDDGRHDSGYGTSGDGYYDENGDYVPRGRSRRPDPADDWQEWEDAPRAAAPRRASSSGGRRQPPPRPRGSARPPRRRSYGLRRFMALLMLLLIGYLVTMIVVVSMVWGSVGRIDAAPDVADRPSGSAGENYLLVGTDSRENLTEEERREFGTGSAEGSRADTVMLLHVPTLGEPTLVSLPRDSYVQIRDYGYNKLNAAHALGGPQLLVDTVEQNTGLRIGGYLEIGFGGFVGVVDQVGGVHMCLETPVKDEKAHVDLEAGCQDLTGPEALGYVRMRYSDQRGDLGRVERQRAFLAALVNQMASPATVLNPWKLHSAGTATGSVLAIGEDTSLFETARMGLALRAVANGKGTSLTVPIGDHDYRTEVGSTVLWKDPDAANLFADLREGRSVTVEP